MLYDDVMDVPDEPYTIPFGEANITREGTDLTIVALGRMVKFANEAADLLAKQKISVTVIDPRTTSPMDFDTILESVEGTGRLVVVDESHPRCSMASDISAVVAQDAFKYLKAPIRMVTPPHVPVPFSPALEDAYIPNTARIMTAARSLLA
jgi:pyruvate dehydrogenase E1 component beta subunit